MSAVSSLLSASSSPLLQRLQQSQGGAPPQPPPQLQSRIQSGLGSAAESAGLDPTQLAQVRSDLQSAIQETLQNLGNGQDPKQALQDTFQQVLSDNGVDTESLESFFQDLQTNARNSIQNALQGGGLLNISGTAPQRSELLTSLLDTLDAKDQEDEQGRGTGTGLDVSSFLGLFSQLPPGSLVNRIA